MTEPKTLVKKLKSRSTTSDSVETEKQQSKVVIPVEGIFKPFEEHLGGNKRVLFSGRFGSGKTYFLNKFLENKAEQYDVYYLNPVNYQVSDNRDIVELIKFDILLELLERDEDVFDTKEDATSLHALFEYIRQNGTVNKGLMATASLLEIGGLIGRPLSTVIKSALKWDEKFQEFKEVYKKGEKGLIMKYMKEIEKKNNLVETDVFSHIIKDKVEACKGERKSVLVLDDLDRIDPEHIFRILNIFSAHHDKNGEEYGNKFGFDKVILVCDYNNIKSIFHHKYGKAADFDAYMDKFYCSHTYEFDNIEAIASALTGIICKYKTKDKYIKNNQLLTSESYWLHGMFRQIIKDSFNLDKQYHVTLRQLLKPEAFQSDSMRRGVYNEYGARERANNMLQSLKISTDVLGGVLGDKEALLLLIGEIIKNSYDDVEFRFVSMNIVMILAITDLEDKQVHTFRDIDDCSYEVKIDNVGKSNLKAKDSEDKILSEKQIWYALLRYCIKKDWNMMTWKNRNN